MLEYRCVVVVFKAHVVKLNLTSNPSQRFPISILFVLCRHLLDIANAIQASKSFRDLCSDGSNLDHWGSYQCGEEDVHKEVTERHGTCKNVASTDQCQEHSDQPNNECRE